MESFNHASLAVQVSKSDVVCIMHPDIEVYLHISDTRAPQENVVYDVNSTLFEAQRSLLALHLYSDYDPDLVSIEWPIA